MRRPILFGVLWLFCQNLFANANPALLLVIDAKDLRPVSFIQDAMAYELSGLRRISLLRPAEPARLLKELKPAGQPLDQATPDLAAKVGKREGADLLALMSIRYQTRIITIETPETYGNVVLMTPKLFHDIQFTSSVTLINVHSAQIVGTFTPQCDGTFKSLNQAFSANSSCLARQVRLALQKHDPVRATILQAVSAHEYVVNLPADTPLEVGDTVTILNPAVATNSDATPPAAPTVLGEGEITQINEDLARVSAKHLQGPVQVGQTQIQEQLSEAKENIKGFLWGLIPH